MGKRYSCHKISEGKADGEALVSLDDIMFYLIKPETGVVIEPSHDLYGKSMAKKILIFPSGKGSSVVQADGLFQLNKNGNMPKAMIIQYPETVLVSSAIIMDIPMVDKVDPAFYEDIKSGDEIIVNADEGYIEII
jgi:predicted aconitase with swiveling domain